MGQARNRGTYEERRSLAITVNQERLQKLDAEYRALRQESSDKHQNRPHFMELPIMAAVAASIASGSRRRL